MDRKKAVFALLGAGGFSTGCLEASLIFDEGKLEGGGNRSPSDGEKVRSADCSILYWGKR